MAKIDKVKEFIGFLKAVLFVPPLLRWNAYRSQSPQAKKLLFNLL